VTENYFNVLTMKK